jgi:release factor glutamine methyltransferase
MNVHGALREASALLEGDGIAPARLTAEVILAHTLQVDRVYLFAHPERVLSDAERQRFEESVRDRLAGKPTQYITGRQEFYGREFRVTPDVLIPRPETEHAVEVALELGRGARRVLDIGTGSGVLAVTLALELGVKTWATDLSPAAGQVAAGNAARLGASVGIVVCDLMSAITSRSMDLVISNPPYVPLGEASGMQREVRDFEPHLALFGGESGCEVYQRIVAGAPRVLRPGGWLILELGYRSLESVRSMLGNWADIRVQPDLAGIPRVIAARRAL